MNDTVAKIEPKFLKFFEATDANPEKRLAILSVAVDVFAEFGYQNADVQVIANRANVGKGTVYRYFVNKEQLFWATSLYVLQQWYGQVCAVLQGNDDPLTKIRKTALIRAEYLEENPNCIEIMMLQRAHFRGEVPEFVQKYMNEQLFEPTLNIIKEAIQNGDIVTDDPMIFFFSMCSALQGALASHCFFADQISLTKMTELAVDTVINGACKKR